MFVPVPGAGLALTTVANSSEGVSLAAVRADILSCLVFIPSPSPFLARLEPLEGKKEAFIIQMKGNPYFMKEWQAKVGHG